MRPETYRGFTSVSGRSRGPAAAGRSHDRPRPCLCPTRDRFATLSRDLRAFLPARGTDHDARSPASRPQARGGRPDAWTDTSPARRRDGPSSRGPHLPSPSPTCSTWALLAVDGRTRSAGYGSRILTHVGQRYPGVPLLLEIEPVTRPQLPAAVRRLAFYERNGFTVTNMLTHEADQTYRQPGARRPRLPSASRLNSVTDDPALPRVTIGRSGAVTGRHCHRASVAVVGPRFPSRVPGHGRHQEDFLSPGARAHPPAPVEEKTSASRPSSARALA